MACKNTWVLNSNVTGGSGNYTYKWSKSSGSSSVVIVGSNTGASCTVEAELLDGQLSAIYRCEVIDADNNFRMGSATFVLNSYHEDNTPPPNTVDVDLSGVPSLIAELAQGTDTAYAGYYMYSNGTHQKRWRNYSTLSPPWLSSGISSDAEVKATLNSGDAPYGDALNTWLSLSTDRNWYLSQSTNGESMNTMTIEIRDKNTLAAVATKTINFHAVKEP